MADLQFLCFSLLSLTKRRLILFGWMWVTLSTESSWSRAGWGLWGGSAAPLVPAGTGGSGVGLCCWVVLAPWSSPWTPSQQRKDLTCLCGRSFQQHSWNKTLLYVCIVLASKLGHFLKSEHGNLTNPDSTDTLSCCVCSPLPLLISRNLWCELCVWEREDPSMPRVLEWMFISHVSSSTKFSLWNTSEMCFWLQIKM